MRARLRTALPVLAAAALSAAGVAAQEGCRFVEGSGNLRTTDVGGGPITRVTTPNLVCRDGVRIRADSATAFQASNYVQLMGRVRFEDPERILTAANAEYFSAVGRLQAHGSVEVVQKQDGAVVRGQELVYNRAGPGRDREQVDVYGGRPTARLFVRPGAPAAPDPSSAPLDPGLARPDSAAAAPLDGAPAGPAADTAAVPYDVEADRILLEGESYFRATGDVEVERGGMQAFGDTVEYDQGGGTLRLARDARMIQEGRDLTAETIHIRLPEDEVREVTARGEAVLSSEEVTLRAPLVRVYFAEGVMERLVAVPIPPVPAPGPGAPLAPARPSEEEDLARPVATAEDFRIVADSLEVVAPGEVLDRIHAAGTARAESAGRDSLDVADLPPLARSDWIEGDTVVATFVRTAAAAPAAPPLAAAPSGGGLQPVPGAAADSARDYALERLSAIGSARSLYRMAPRDSARARGDLRPAIHYVAADEIVIDFEGGEIAAMDVTGRTEGMHLEPLSPGAGADSVAVDSAAVEAAPADSVPADAGSGGAAADSAGVGAVGLVEAAPFGPHGGRGRDDGQREGAVARIAPIRRVLPRTGPRRLSGGGAR